MRSEVSFLSLLENVLIITGGPRWRVFCSRENLGPLTELCREVLLHMLDMDVGYVG